MSAYYDLMRVWVLHNNEEKQNELSTNEIIFAAQDSWKLVEI